MNPTINDASSWEQPFTSNRVMVVTCSKCGNKRYELSGAHGVHWSEVKGERVLVNCIGEVVTRGE